MRYQGSWPAKEYLDANPGIKASFLAIAQHLATHGKVEVSERAHMLKGKYRDIWEAKPRGHRILGFRHDSIMYLTNGAPKGNKRSQEADYKIALKMRDDFYAQLQNEERLKQRDE